MVGPVDVEGEVAEEFSGLRRDDPDLKAGDEHDDWCAGVGSADANLVEVGVVAEGDFA